jgi:Mg-chelatase subunit ChlI
LLDRFGLMVSVTAETNEAERTMILQTVLEFDEAVSQLKAGESSAYIDEALEKIANAGCYWRKRGRIFIASRCQRTLLETA